MGIGICRLGDLSIGETPYSPRPNIEGSPKVFVDGIPVHRIGDKWSPHIYPSPHPGPSNTTVTGSPKCFADGLAMARIGDSISCGDSIATGSSKSFCV